VLITTKSTKLNFSTKEKKKHNYYVLELVHNSNGAVRISVCLVEYSNVGWAIYCLTRSVVYKDITSYPAV